MTVDILVYSSNSLFLPQTTLRPPVKDRLAVSYMFAVPYLRGVNYSRQMKMAYQIVNQDCNRYESRLGYKLILGGQEGPRERWTMLALELLLSGVTREDHGCPSHQ